MQLFSKLSFTALALALTQLAPASAAAEIEAEAKTSVGPGTCVGVGLVHELHIGENARVWSVDLGEFLDTWDWFIKHDLAYPRFAIDAQLTTAELEISFRDDRYKVDVWTTDYAGSFVKLHDSLMPDKQFHVVTVPIDRPYWIDPVMIRAQAQTVWGDPYPDVVVPHLPPTSNAAVIKPVESCD